MKTLVLATTLLGGMWLTACQEQAAPDTLQPPALMATEDNDRPSCDRNCHLPAEKMWDSEQQMMQVTLAPYQGDPFMK